MIIWRPANTIRVKTIGLAWRDKRLLAAEVEDDAGHVKGVRPLGGTIEFGETRERALEREFLEELGFPIRVTGAWHALENIYEHEGFTGHEMMFAADIEFVDDAVYDQNEFLFNEDNGMPCRARWFDTDELAARGVELYPIGLARLIESLSSN